MTFNSHKTEQIVHAMARPPYWGSLVKGLQSKSYMLVTSTTLSRVIISRKTGHYKPTKMLSRKQTNALHDEMRTILREMRYSVREIWSHADRDIRF